MTPQSLTTRTLDEAIAAAVARVGERARTHGGAMARLGEALIEATTGGKRVRPALVVRSCAAFGGDPDASETLQVAASFELLHTAFLLHDDVIDHDTLRRGVPNVSARLAAWASEQGADAASAADLGAAAAILGGDLLLAEAQRLILRTPVDDERLDALAELFSQSLAVTVAGELADVAHAALGQRAGAFAILTATHDKTAVYSFAAPLTAGAVLAGATATQRTTMRACGSDLGLAFQLANIARDIEEAVRLVAEGAMLLGPQVTRRLVEDFARDLQHDPSTMAKLESFKHEVMNREEVRRAVVAAREATSCFRRRPRGVHECHADPHVSLTFFPLSPWPRPLSGSLPISLPSTAVAARPSASSRAPTARRSSAGGSAASSAGSGGSARYGRS